MIYLLTRIGSHGYDEFDAFVVRAANEKEARQSANSYSSNEGKIWTDKTKVHCAIVAPTGTSQEILGSFNAG